MKTSLYITIALGAFLISSCKKERTCVCTTISQGITSTSDSIFDPDTKKSAKADCSKMNDGGDDGIGGIYYTTCELK